MRERWLNRIFYGFAAVGLALLLFMTFHDSGGTDLAGRGMQIGYGVMLLLVLLCVVALFRFSRARILKLLALAIVALPPLAFALEFLSDLIEGRPL